MYRDPSSSIQASDHQLLCNCPCLINAATGPTLPHADVRHANRRIATGIREGNVVMFFGIQKRCCFPCGAPPLCSVVIGDQARSTAWKGKISMVALAAVAMATRGVVENRMSMEPFRNHEGGAKGDTMEAQERLDMWMRDSVVEIVKNLKEASLLVQVFSKRKGHGLQQWRRVSCDRGDEGATMMAVKVAVR